MNAARTKLTVRRLLNATVLAGALVLMAAPVHAASSRQTFETPEAAMAAFGEAVAINDEAALKVMLGADFREFIPPVGADIRYTFLELWAQARAIKRVDDKRAHLDALWSGLRLVWKPKPRLDKPERRKTASSPAATA